MAFQSQPLKSQIHSQTHLQAETSAARRSFLFADYAGDAEPALVSAVCPGGPARHFRVQARATTGSAWQSVKVCVTSTVAEQAAEEWTRRGWRTRVIAYRTAPAAA